MSRCSAAIILTETWLNDDNKDLANIPGYIGFHTIRLNRRSGEVSVFVRDDLNAVIHKDLCLSDQTIESCVKVACGSESVVLLGIYRPHSDSIINFLDRIVVSLVGSLCNSRVNVICDFNADFLDNYSNCVTCLTNSLNQLHFVSALNKQTRFIPNGADGSLLDHIWLNCPDMYTAGIILSDVTDHCPTFIIVKIPDTVKNEKVKISVRLVDELGMQEFESGLRCVSWSFSDDINQEAG